MSLMTSASGIANPEASRRIPAGGSAPESLDLAGTWGFAALPDDCRAGKAYMESGCDGRGSLVRQRTDGPMSDTHIRPTAHYKREVSAEGGALFRTLINL